jgi:uncharacterized BrkB/YihY/UPF0761 family membrane protein
LDIDLNKLGTFIVKVDSPESAEDAKLRRANRRLLFIALVFIAVAWALTMCYLLLTNRTPETQEFVTGGIGTSVALLLGLLTRK